MLTIDGSFGEGGGQIIRTSLALALVTGKPFRVERVRANRGKPGLQRQHLTAVNAAAAVGRAEVSGAAVGASEFIFEPRGVVAGEYSFAVNTAGSATLVLQTVLPPLMTASAPSLLTLEGGTHNVYAPPYDFLETTFLPLINRIGPRIGIELERYGFYPPGGGKFCVTIEPAPLCRLDLIERGEMHNERARALVVKLPPMIAERELAVVRERMKWRKEQLRVETSTNALSPGNVVMIEFASKHLTEMFSRVGERGVRAETIAEDAVREARGYLATDAPVGAHLADQLLIPLALARGGEWELMPGVKERLAEIDWGVGGALFGIASNQGGVGVGHLTFNAAYELLAEMVVAAFGVKTPPAGSIEICPHAPHANCACRKPKPLMLIRLMHRFGAQRDETLFVGDMNRDEEAARRARVAFMWAHEFFDR